MYVFIDLETTGLDPRVDLIMEAAFAIVDDEFEIVDERNFIFPMSSWIEAKLDNADPIVIEMHTANHLIADCTKLQAEGNGMSHGFYKRVLEAVVLDWFAMCGLAPGTVEMAGSGVHFDRAFLKEHMPKLEEWFHYRNWDTSTLGRAAQRWAPEWYAKNEVFKRESLHRALPDVHDSLAKCEQVRSIFTISERMWPSFAD